MSIIGNSNLHKMTEGMMWRVFRSDVFILLIKRRKYFLKTRRLHCRVRPCVYMLRGLHCTTVCRSKHFCFSIVYTSVCLAGWMATGQNEGISSYGRLSFGTNESSNFKMFLWWTFIFINKNLKKIPYSNTCKNNIKYFQINFRGIWI